MISGHQRLAEEPGPEVRNDHGNLRKSTGDVRDGQRMAETKVERARQAKFPANGDGEHTAVDENRRLLIGRPPEHALHALVVQPISVHRRKETDRTHLQVFEGAFEHRI